MSKRKLETDNNDDDPNKRQRLSLQKEKKKRFRSVSYTTESGILLICFYQETPIPFREIQQWDTWSHRLLVIDLWNIIAGYIPQATSMYILQMNHYGPTTSDEEEVDLFNLPEGIRNSQFQLIKCSNGKTSDWDRGFVTVGDDVYNIDMEDVIARSENVTSDYPRMWSNTTTPNRILEIMTLDHIDANDIKTKEFLHITGQLPIPILGDMSSELHLAILKVIRRRGLLLNCESYRNVKLEVQPSKRHLSLHFIAYILSTTFGWIPSHDWSLLPPWSLFLHRCKIMGEDAVRLHGFYRDSFDGKVVLPPHVVPILTDLMSG